MAGLAANVDFVNVMTYDAAGAWSPATGANAGMSLINAAIAGYRAAGLPAHQLQIGIPLYARAFAGVKFSGNKAQIVTGGLPFNKAVAAPGTVEPSVVDYNDLAANYLPTYSKGYDTVENSLTVWNEQKGIWISAEDATTAKIKANLAVTHGLAGVFVWEPSQETTNTVIRAIKVALN
ncbi:glycoside hydrolase [Blastocladiella britannica]|nr:glycoside hydrolase [Blastocladiella britannica]